MTTIPYSLLGRKEQHTYLSDDINASLLIEQNTIYYNGTSTDETKASGHSEWQGLGQQLWIFMAPVIFIIGIIGNILILLIMGRKKFKGTTTCVYLRAMALADLLVLLTGMLPEWLSANYDITFKLISAATCKTEKFISYSIGDTAIWILVVFTVDRFVAVCFPLHKSDIFSPSKAKYWCLGALLTSFVKNFHVIWTRGPEYFTNDDGEEVLKKMCGRPEPFTTFERFIRPWIAFALISAIPFFVIILCNTGIIRTLIMARRQNLGHKKQSSKQDKTYMQLTFMCLSASFAFLFFITPSIVLLIGKPYWSQNNDAYAISKAVNNQLTYVNHSINFFLYCISGKRFRIELCKLIGKRSWAGSNLETTTDSRTQLYKVNPITPISSRKDSNKNGFVKLEKVDKRVSSV